MKKILILMIATASLLLAEANVTTPVTSTTSTDKTVTVTTKVKKPCKCKLKSITLEKRKCKCTTGMKCSCKGACKCKGMHQGQYAKTNSNKKGFTKNYKRNPQRAKQSVLLFKKGLTPLLRIVFMSAKDPLLGLDVEQMAQFLIIKKDIMPRSKSIKKEIRMTKRAVITAVTAGTTVEAIKADIEKLALLQAKATLLRIECINRTKAVLNKNQLIYLLGKSMNKHTKQKKRCNAKRCHIKR